MSGKRKRRRRRRREEKKEERSRRKFQFKVTAAKSWKVLLDAFVSPSYASLFTSSPTLLCLTFPICFFLHPLTHLHRSSQLASSSAFAPFCTLLKSNDEKLTCYLLLPPSPLSSSSFLLLLLVGSYFFHSFFTLPLFFFSSCLCLFICSFKLYRQLFLFWMICRTTLALSETNFFSKIRQYVFFFCLLPPPPPYLNKKNKKSENCIKYLFFFYKYWIILKGWNLLTSPSPRRSQNFILYINNNL